MNASEGLAAQVGGTASEIVWSIFGRYATDLDGDRRPAVLHDGTEISYLALKHVTLDAIEVLRNNGVMPGDHVALFMPNAPEYIVWMLAGLAYGTPITPVHPKISTSDLAFILDDAEIRLLIYSDGQAPTVGELNLETGAHRHALPAGACWSGQSVESATGLPRSLLDPSDIAFIAYTGGTTGRPKGVIQTHQMLRQNVLMELAEWPWPRTPRFLAATPLSHAAGFFVLPTLLLGGSITTTARVGVEGLGEVARANQVTVTFLVPSLIHSIVANTKFAKEQFGTLDMLVYGASPIAEGDLARCLEIFASKLVQLYGQTEAPMILTTLRPEDHDDRYPSRLRGCGVPSVGVTVTIRDQADNELLSGEIGEICARGPLVMPGYWNRPHESAEALRSGWLHTGDLGTVDSDGYISIVGRKKDMIISGGFNVYPKEIEVTLLGHPDVSEAAVVGVPDARWGERIVAVIVPVGQVDIQEIKSFVRDRKGPIQTPKDIVIVSEIPLTAVGKPDKVALRQQLLEI